MPKPKARNGFYRFKTMKQRELGYLQEEQLMAECDRLWRNMTEEQKAAFSNRGDATTRDASDSRGRNVALTPQEKKRREEEETEQKREEVIGMIKGCPWLDPSADLKIIIMEMNFWAIGDLGGDVLEAAPAEIGLVEMSIKAGVQRAKSWILHHGKIPLSMRLKCQRESDTGHKLPLSTIIDGNTSDAQDYMRTQAEADAVLEEILEFVGDAGKVFVAPVLYHCSKNLKHCTLGLEFLCAKAGRDYDSELKGVLGVYDLAKFFYDAVFEVRKAKAVEEENKKEESKRMTEKEIENEIKRGEWPSYQTAGDKFWQEFQHAFTAGVACPEFHAALDADNKCCALARAKRYSYCICDIACNQLGIPLTLGVQFASP